MSNGSWPEEPALAEAEGQTSTLFEREGFRHAFFTRRGGVSLGAYGSLNFSATTGDATENVSENLRRAARVLGVGADRIFYLSQVHGVGVHEVQAADTAEQARKIEADAVMGRAPGLACAVRTADCVPLLLADRETGAVAAVHAGWRGTVRGVVGEAVRALRALSGSRSGLLAAIGPHISVDAFEVSPEVADELRAAAPATGVVRPGPRGRPHVDLRAIVAAQLRELDIEENAIDHVEGCTLSEPERYFSYRRDGPKSGRHLSAIVARRR